MTRSPSSRVFAPLHTGHPAELYVSGPMLDRPFQDMFGCQTRLSQECLHIGAKCKLMYLQETLIRISYALGFKDAQYFLHMFRQTEPPLLFRHAANLVRILMRNKS